MLKFFVFLPLLLTCFPGQQDVEELIARHMEAMGGVQGQKAIQTVRITQKIETGNPANDSELTIMRKRGNKFRMENPPLTPGTERQVARAEDTQIPALAMRIISGCDGQTGWFKLGNQPAKAVPSLLRRSSRHRWFADGLQGKGNLN